MTEPITAVQREAAAAASRRTRLAEIAAELRALAEEPGLTWSENLARGSIRVSETTHRVGVLTAELSALLLDELEVAFKAAKPLATEEPVKPGAAVQFADGRHAVRDGTARRYPWTTVNDDGQVVHFAWPELLVHMGSGWRVVPPMAEWSA